MHNIAALLWISPRHEPPIRYYFSCRQSQFPGWKQHEIALDYTLVGPPILCGVRAAKGSRLRGNLLVVCACS